MRLEAKAIPDFRSFDLGRVFLIGCPLSWVLLPPFSWAHVPRLRPHIGRMMKANSKKGRISTLLFSLVSCKYFLPVMLITGLKNKGVLDLQSNRHIFRRSLEVGSVSHRTTELYYVGVVSGFSISNFNLGCGLFIVWARCNSLSFFLVEIRKNGGNEYEPDSGKIYQI